MKETKLKKMKKLLNIALILFLAQTAIAQAPDLKLPDDPELASEARRRFALSVDEMSIKNYRGAADALNWLMKNVPNLYDGQYINGYKAYEELAKSTSDETLKNTYLDSMFICYERKKELYGLTDRELNNKAYRYFKYWKTNRDRIEDGFAAYQEAYKKPDAVINNNIVSYMDMCRRVSAYKKTLTDDDVLEIYFQINDLIDTKQANGEDEAKMDRYREAVTGILIQTIGEEKLNCDFINTNLAPGLDQGEDPKLAKKVFGLLLSQECSDSPYFEKAAMIIQKNEPTGGLAKVLAQRAYAKKNYDEATKWYKQAIEINEDPAAKGELQMDIAKLNLTKGDKATARTAALEAIKLNPLMDKEAYKFIGNLYMGSFNECARKQSQIDDRAVFMVAYDAFQKAGDRAGMAQAKAQFPTVSDVFTANKKEGDAVKVGCWIQVSTTIKTRPSE